MTAIFLASWAGQSFTAWSEYNDEQRDHGTVPVSWWTYVARPDFWEKTL